jgi:hypothetical protein
MAHIIGTRCLPLPLAYAHTRASFEVMRRGSWRGLLDATGTQGAPSMDLSLVGRRWELVWKGGTAAGGSSATAFKGAGLPSSYPDDAPVQLEVPTIVNLQDPQSLGTLRVPVRGELCDHLRCFDLGHYLDSGLHLTSQPRTDSKRHTRLQPWNCPVCQRFTPPSSLWVDTLVVGLMKILSYGHGRGDFADMDAGSGLYRGFSRGAGPCDLAVEGYRLPSAVADAGVEVLFAQGLDTIGTAESATGSRQRWRLNSPLSIFEMQAKENEVAVEEEEEGPCFGGAGAGAGASRAGAGAESPTGVATRASSRQRPGALLSSPRGAAAQAAARQAASVEAICIDDDVQAVQVAGKRPLARPAGGNSVAAAPPPHPAFRAASAASAVIDLSGDADDEASRAKRRKEAGHVPGQVQLR